MKNSLLKNLYIKHKETSLSGRYIHTKSIAPLLNKHSKFFKIETIGQSVLSENIYSITLGTGPNKILMWSQMHGNESTTTKALFDLLNLFSEDKSNNILKNCTILIVPILNPDGALAYTRLNANNVDLNRDAQALSQPESVVLNTLFNDFKPHFCFNLHGQRTIFSAGNTNSTASLSFLSPAQDQECTITDNRKVAMSLIVKINNMLQEELPNQVGTYDDAYNINCVGDAFQSLNVPTVLFEAGHCKNDYNREEVRRYVFQSYLVALNAIANNQIELLDFEDYLNIPENKKLFYDIIIKNVLVNNRHIDIAVHYEERLIDEKVNFIPKISKIDNLDGFFAHKYIEANGYKALEHLVDVPQIGSEIDFVIIDNVKLLLNVE
ncbi:DUF2817 domain-containing protein [Lacinutrix sp. MedPE-SW]|uniref:DUF2817 domain-containing protein n=1 Tax=Lacinutrix sp. MedPE-SW TaxID=1860087 RepID=UPI00091559BE|nr:DUF2817 domain-containing protein [Lacinutrix sp. MedPE-SW]OIQ23917.1 MAG: peptidase M14 [Lacinutrix sp. MedPE-SW]